jgi:O-antigen/teichoic acid export membrane protein
MLAKFILIVHLSKVYGVSAFGEFSIFSTTVLFVVSLIGIDFYTFSTRELIRASENDRKLYLGNQLMFHLFSYILFFPLLIFLFFGGVISFKHMFVFYLILLCEHLSLELYRIFSSLSRLLFANVLLCFRAAFWIYAIVFFTKCGFPFVSDIESVYYFWLAGNSLSVVIGSVYLYKLYPFPIRFGKDEMSWVKSGLRVSLHFFIGTIAYKVIEFSGRYVIDFYMTKADVGVFSLFSGLANSMQTVVITLVTLNYYPILVRQYHDKDISGFKTTVRRFFKELLFYSVLMVGAVLIFIKPLLLYIGKKEYLENVGVMWIMMGGIFFLNLSFLPHYILYAANRDILIRNITIIGAVINILLNILLVKLCGLTGIAFSIMISYAFVFFVKLYKVYGFFSAELKG